MQPTDMNDDRTRTGKRRRVMLDAESKSKLLKWCDSTGFSKYLGALKYSCHNNRALCAGKRKTTVYELIRELGLSARVSGRSATPEEMERTVDEHLRTFVLDERRGLPFGTTYAEKNGTKDKKLSQPEQMTFNLKNMFNNFDESTSKFTPTPVAKSQPRTENPNSVHTIDALESRPVPDQILGIVKAVRKAQTGIDGKLDDITAKLCSMETTLNRAVAFIQLVAAAASAFSKSYETQV